MKIHPIKSLVSRFKTKKTQPIEKPTATVKTAQTDIKTQKAEKIIELESPKQPEKAEPEKPQVSPEIRAIEYNFDKIDKLKQICFAALEYFMEANPNRLNMTVVLKNDTKMTFFEPEEENQYVITIIPPKNSPIAIQRAFFDKNLNNPTLLAAKEKTKAAQSLIYYNTKTEIGQIVINGQVSEIGKRTLENGDKLLYSLYANQKRYFINNELKAILQFDTEINRTKITKFNKDGTVEVLICPNDNDKTYCKDTYKEGQLMHEEIYCPAPYSEKILRVYNIDNPGSDKAEINPTGAIKRKDDIISDFLGFKE